MRGRDFWSLPGGIHIASCCQYCEKVVLLHRSAAGCLPRISRISRISRSGSAEANWLIYVVKEGGLIRRRCDVNQAIA